MNKYSRKHVFDKEGKLLPLKERTYKTNEGYDLAVIGGGSKEGYVTCKIEDYIFEAAMGAIKKGNIKNPDHASVYEKGYLGVGIYKSNENGKPTICYNLWENMLTRAYSKVYHKKQPTYKGVEVCEEWLNFQNFATWFYKESNYQEGWALDKDLLSEKDKKIYSPHTCVFIPQALNNFLTNDKASNTSGCIGVTWHKGQKKWKARIKDVETNSRLYLGFFDDIEDAARAYKKARKGQAQIWRDRMDSILPDKALRNIR